MERCSVWAISVLRGTREPARTEAKNYKNPGGLLPPRPPVIGIIPHRGITEHKGSNKPKGQMINHRHLARHGRGASRSLPPPYTPPTKKKTNHTTDELPAPVVDDQ